jgi:nucleotide-binding universal stress UspA family protein
MFKNILIPVDDSSCSSHAANVGLELARRFDANVFITHVIEELPKIYQGGDWAEGLLEQAEKVLDKWRTKNNDVEPKLNVAVVTHKDVAQGILNTAYENACNLIVMGTHGRKGLAHAFLGSVAERVTRLATIPVMLIRETKHTPSTTFQRILVAVDGSTANRKALNYADHFAQLTDAELHLVHVIPGVPPPLVDPLGVGGVAASLGYNDTLKQLEHDARIVMEVSKAELETTNTVFHTARAQRERVADVIVNYAKENQCDLIVMGTHGRTGFNRLLLGSVAEGVTHNAPVPLLLIHLAQQPAMTKEPALQTASTQTPTNSLQGG